MLTLCCDAMAMDSAFNNTIEIVTGLTVYYVPRQLLTKCNTNPMVFAKLYIRTTKSKYIFTWIS